MARRDPSRALAGVLCVAALGAAAAPGWALPSARAQEFLAATTTTETLLDRAGYSAVPLRRLPPGVLAVDVLLDGQAARLIVDSGDGVPGFGLTTSSAKRLKIKTEPSAQTIRGVT